MKAVRTLVAGLVLGVAWTPSATLAGDDPLRSPGWHLMEDRFFPDAVVVHDDRVRVMAPPGAEDATAVHGFVRVDGIDDIQRLLVFADLNPIPRIVDMRPHRAASAIGFQFKVQQATPLRAAVQTADGTWHVGGTWVDAAGGGCSAPSIASANPEWQDRLGDLRGRSWQLADGRQRLSFSVIHPMDTGLAPGIPLFYVEEIGVHGEDGERLATLEIDASMAENPEITLEIPGQGVVRVSGRDNNGNRFAGALR
ncbi:quinoprotein dehydrogenase-associated SoxYZ-like carrier [Aquisalimonas asiatica]|uniref:Sulfur-oxidizing protein SoxY n=1 Tax=Aquisalimonas asiatica TaxID=406100 RepID=A0A1H8S612_9GAMM|nr:quinoprotein dehydrogenase-associated SoxYZ-like carrier [Aquisalimonas asiatica]SEO74075.1 sulfur-oxidizing protein SoxY [Aquisalimonas asiatica]